ncbi:MAG TPA: FAD-dependent oxidoreductase [Streptosporangiaceae bacterium]|nr:FAD-dependent oxidoreductase [Streptosporangiaceae bacterium]
MSVPSEVDVAVIGGGVVGCAVARELAGYRVRVALLEAGGDVGQGTSKANTAILHTGFDAIPGSLESELVARGYALLSGYSAVTGIPVERTGAVLVAWTGADLEALPGLRERAAKNGYDRCEIVGAQAVYAMVPSLAPGVLGGLTVPDESIICPWTTTLAFATQARQRGAQLLFRHRVTGLRAGPEDTVLSTEAGQIRARWVVNAAGLRSDLVDEMYGFRRFTVTPRRGELLVFDKLARPLADKIILPVPSAAGKGVLISPTIYGNVLLGPTAENLTDRDDTSTSARGLEFLLAKGRAIMPSLLEEEVTACYAGLRAATDRPDYVVEIDPGLRYLLLGGIRSTGLTASMALAEHARVLLSDAGLTLEPRDDLPDPPRMPNIGETRPRPYLSGDQIAADPEYGTIVCFCERVSRGEIRDALASPVPPRDLEGLRRRTRAGMGRCQGFYCGAEVGALMRSANR